MSRDPDITWRTTSIPPVDPSRFGRDHWSTFAYLETRIVEHRGTINHDHMRTHARRHPAMMSAKKVALSAVATDGSKYPTELAGGEELTDHDDYDCVDDLIAAGLLTVKMPELKPYNDVEAFVDAWGNPVRDVEGFLLDPDFVTGMDELRLCTYATFALTERGYEVAAKLRRHLAENRHSCAGFRMG